MVPLQNFRSTMSIITICQAARIHKVMLNCPEELYWNQALDELSPITKGTFVVTTTIRNTTEKHPIERPNTTRMVES